MSQFTNVVVEWYDNTFLFYILIILISFLIMSFCKGGIIKVSRLRISIPFAIVTTLLVFIKGFGTTGRDLRTGYFVNFKSADSFASIHDQSLEIGYKFLNVLVRMFGGSYQVFILVIGVLTVFPVMYLMYKYKDEIDIPLTTLLYMSIFFFSSFSPLRNYLAASISLLAFDSMKEKRMWRSLLWIILATSVHSSLILLLIPFFLLFMRRFNKSVIIFVLVIAFVVAFWGKDDILDYFTTSMRYSIYAVNNFEGFGLEQITYYFPVFMLIFLMRKKSDKYYERLSLCYMGTGFLCGMLSYVITVFGRTTSIFLPMIFIVGYYLRLMKDTRPKLKWLVNAGTIMYCCLRFFLYIYQYYKLEDLMPYTNIFGWKI